MLKTNTSKIAWKGAGAILRYNITANTIHKGPQCIVEYKITLVWRLPNEA
jgi:hypothetical protein